MVDVPEQGKGHAVRAAFATLADFDAVLLTDGDGTYPAEAAPLLIAPVLEGSAEMTVGARQPTPGAGAMTLIRGVGNRLIRAAFRLLIGPGNTDLLSGYRAFSRRFRQEVRLRSSGFEIETELAGEAAARGAAGHGDLGALPPPDRRHHEQAAGVPRRPADPDDDHHAGHPAPTMAADCLLGAIPLTLLGVDGPLGLRRRGGAVCVGRCSTPMVLIA